MFSYKYPAATAAHPRRNHMTNPETDDTPTPTPLTGSTVVVTGGTNGIGAATALTLRRQGARVIIVGRSQTKADSLVTQSAGMGEPGSLEAIVADFASMTTVESVVAQIAERTTTIDVLIHAVGIFLTTADYTIEGIEKDFAVSYLSRFVFLEKASRLGLLAPTTRLINLAAPSPQMPKRAQMDFDDLTTVAGRTGFAAHSQAQTANDLLTAQAGTRYGIAALGYGPGNVDTGILRELPLSSRVLFFPFTRNKRTPQQAADQLSGLLSSPDWRPGEVGFANKKGRFVTPAFINDAQRQANVITISTELARQALGRELGAQPSQ